MPLTKESKETIVKNFGKNPADTGNAEVQVALLSERISSLTEHLKINKKDHHCRYGLLKLVGQRRSLLDYLHRTEIERYRSIIGKLKIRK